MKREIRRKGSEVRSGMTELMIRGIEANLPAEDADEGFEEPYLDWTELHEVMSASELIDSMKRMPFSLYIRRYLLGKHGIKLPSPEDCAAGKWPVTDAEFINLVRSDFENNGCVPKKKKQENGMLFPCSGRWMPDGELAALLSADQIKSADLICLAFGLGMPFGVLNDFLRKVCRRSGLNLWNEKELFAYIVFRFTDKDPAPERQTAFAAIAEAYKKENTTEKKVLYDTYRTESIRSYADRMVLSAAGGEESIRRWLAQPENEMPETLRVLLREYRKTQNAKGNYVRTASKNAFDLWKSFREVCADDIASYEQGGAMEKEALEIKRRMEGPEEEEEPKNTVSEGGKTAFGSVQFRYQPGRSFTLPKGVKLQFKGHDFIFRENETADFTIPADALTPLKIAVRSEKKASDPSVTPVTKAERFRSADRRFYDIGPSSSFKEKKAGKDVYLEGNLEIRCPFGTSVAEGSIFIEEGTGNVYRTTRTAECPAECTAVSDMEVSKDQLTKATFVMADGKPWKLPAGVRIGNKKIGFGKFERETARSEAPEEKEVTGEQGVTVKYLYYSHAKEDLHGDMALDAEHLRLLKENIFRPETKLSASKIYSLEKRRKIDVTREDILTLVFLNFAALRQFGDLDDEELEAPPKQWLAAFIQTADRVLGDCGFGGVYRADPYDAMLSYLAAATDEPLNAFRNLWGMILHE